LVLLDETPEPVLRHQALGGVLEFVRFADANGCDATLRMALEQTLRRVSNDQGYPEPFTLDLTTLRALQPVELTQTKFFGSAFDPASGQLVLRSTWTDTDGRTFRNPTFAELAGYPEMSSGMTVHPAETGQFAYAFLDPPYGLRGTRAEKQALFDDICGLILPPGLDCTILDWCCNDLQAVSDYFDAGMEWWGMFLFTIHVPSRRSLTVITASTTD